MIGKNKIACCLLSSVIGLGIFSSVSSADLNKVDLIGKDRYDTANKIAKNYFKNPEKVIIVNSRAISDALSVAPLAKEYDAPVLLVDTNSINAETKYTINKLSPKEILIIGGHSSVSNQLEKNLSSKYKVDRITGTNRMETSVNIYKRLKSKSEKVFVVNGYTGLADAASIGGVAAELNAPLLLVNNNETSFKNVIKNIGSKGVFLIGGENSIPKKFEKMVKSQRIYGKNRIETNSEILKKFYNGKISNIFIAKDGSFNESEIIDSVAIGSVSGKLKIPLMLSTKINGINQEQKEIIKKYGIKNAIEVGGGNEVAEKQIKLLIEEIKLKNSDDKKVNESNNNSNSSGGSGSSYDYKKIEHDKTKNKVDASLSEIAKELNENPILRDIININFNASSGKITIEIKEKDLSEDKLEEIKNLNIVEKLKKINSIINLKVSKDENILTNNYDELKTLIENKFNTDNIKSVEDLVTDVNINLTLQDSMGQFNKKYIFQIVLSDDVKKKIDDERIELNDRNTVDEVEQNLETVFNNTFKIDFSSDVFNVNFNKEKRNILLEIKVDSLSKIDFSALNDEKFSSGLKSINNLQGYSLQNTDRNIIDSEVSDINNNLINDLQSLINSVDDIEKLDEKSTELYLKVKGERDILPITYSLKFSLTDEVKSKIENEKIKKEHQNTENVVNEKLFELSKIISSNDSINNIFDITFDKDKKEGVIEIKKSKLEDFNFEKISNTNFISKLKEIEYIKGYLLNDKFNRIKDEDSDAIKGYILNDINSFIQDKKNIEDFNNKEISLHLHLEDSKGAFTSQYKIIVRISKAVQKEIDDEKRRNGYERAIEGQNQEVKDAAKQQDAHFKKALSYFNGQRKKNSNPYYLTVRKENNIIDFSINPDEYETSASSTVRGTGLYTMLKDIFTTPYVKFLKINDGEKKDFSEYKPELPDSGVFGYLNKIINLNKYKNALFGEKMEDKTKLKDLVGMNIKVFFESEVGGSKFNREFLIKITDNYKQNLEYYKNLEKPKTN